jgi:HK97 family phage prohead protease
MGEESVMAHYTEALGTVREVADAPRTIEGIAIPYGVVSLDTELGKEAFAPGAFRNSVAHWMARPDGARMPYRSKHGADPIGVVTDLRDEQDGVHFRAEIDDGPEGDRYLSRVRKGLNGVSIEPSLNDLHRGVRTRDGVVIHREVRLLAIAAAVSPAYDGARVAAREMEEALVSQEENKEAGTEVASEQPAVVQPREAKPAVLDAAPAHVEIDPATRSAAEKADPIVQQIQRTPVYITREALIYGREAASLPDGSHPSFLSDGFHAWKGDRDAADRQYRYGRAMAELAAGMERDALTAFRAGDVLSSEIPGAFPNEYVPSLLTPRILKGRPMGGFFARFPITDANPKIFPKVTTSTTVAVQSAEGANPAASDLATTAVSVTPALYGAVTDVSRQVIDGSNPNAEAMLLQDMLEAYAQASETVIKTAVEAGATASGQAITAATPFAGLVANIVAYSSARFLPAAGQFIPSALWAVAAKQPDTGSLRPLLSPINPQNAAGVLTGGTLGANLLGADVFHSYASTVNVVVTARPDDYVIYESAITQFTFEQVVGPSAIRIGIWAYLGVGTRKGGLSVTAA